MNTPPSSKHNKKTPLANNALYDSRRSCSVFRPLPFPFLNDSQNENKLEETIPRSTGISKQHIHFLFRDLPRFTPSSPAGAPTRRTPCLVSFKECQPARMKMNLFLLSKKARKAHLVVVARL